MAHVSGDNVELVPPLRVTDTHVVVNITDLSLWGLVRRFIPFLTTRWQVLPFLQPLGPLDSVLNLVVLPYNVPLQEVVLPTHPKHISILITMVVPHALKSVN